MDITITPKSYSIRDTFDMKDIPAGVMVQGCEPGQYGTPAVDPHYVFEKERMRELTMFWAGGFKALMIEGDPSAGKTSIIEQWHARLNWPLFKVPCSPTTSKFDLVGGLVPSEDGKLRYHYGPVALACKHGASVLLDEYNTLDPGEATGLNMLLEGYSWMVPETGEIITPKRTTRFFVTQNSVDSRAAVAGRNLQDVANDDRFSYMYADYLKQDLEEALVTRVLTAGGRFEESRAQQIANITVTVANAVRTAFRIDNPAIEKPMSTRAVLRWAKYSVLYQDVMRAQGKSGIHYAVRQALKMPASMATAINEMITAVCGFDENLQSK